jgi:hypothetical protein
MRAGPRSRWQQKKQHRYATGIVVFLVLILFIFFAYRFGWGWTGFNSATNQITITSTSNGNYTATISQPSKTLWDWLGLLAALAIPVVVGVGAAWFTVQQGKASDRENKDNQLESALQTYIDKISELLLKEHLGERTVDGKLKPEHEHVRNIARVRTITVLRQLDGRRVGYVFAFLNEAELMSATKDDNAISLKNADFHAVDWSQADLRGVNLSGANLSEANLSGAIFSSTIYVIRAFGGTLVLPNHADLSGADLSEANLYHALIDKEQLEKVKSLKGTNMPDGSQHA